MLYFLGEFGIVPSQKSSYLLRGRISRNKLFLRFPELHKPADPVAFLLV